MAASVLAQPTVFVNRHQRQERMGYCLLAALFALLELAATVAFRYTLPQPNLVLLGSVADFPPSPTPYRFLDERAIVYVVNTGKELLVFDPRTTHPTIRCEVIWYEPNHRFEDPCLGTKFDLVGNYLVGPAMRNLDRYALSESNGQLWVNLHQLQPGQSIDGYCDYVEHADPPELTVRIQGGKAEKIYNQPVTVVRIERCSS